jgi:alkanesulfonate monooxygenase SsuD/methylene tetrahydromethanopterin reductase-like flavin-dependent oxidoreductase (luciferase family)
VAEVPMGTHIRFDMRAPEWGPADPAELYGASLDMAEWADGLDLDTVVLSEHHDSDDGFLPSPIVAAAAIAGRTKRIRISLSALLLPLYDPIKAAEDLAVLDLLSEGRVSTILGLGYRPEEYAMFDAPWDTRGQWFDECIEALLRAWTGEPFEFQGRPVRVTPRPASRPHPLGFVGGRSKPAARRAARFDLPFFPDSGDPVLRDEYEAACRAAGREPGLMIAPDAKVSYTFVHDDPDRYWEQIGPHLLHEALTYRGWQQDGSSSSASTDDATIAELKAGHLFEIMTPDEAVTAFRQGRHALLYPLCGGIPPELAWESLERFERDVLPAVRAPS